MLAALAIAPISLHGQYLLGDVDGLLWPAEPEDIGGAWKGIRLAVRHAHAAADGHVVAGDFTALDDRDEPEVLSEYVDVIVRRHGDYGLELARQVVTPVERLLVLYRGTTGVRHLRTVEPDLMISAGPRQQMRAQRARQVQRLAMRLRYMRVRRRQHVAIDVAAGGDGVEQCRVDRLHGAAHVRLDDSMELKRLPRGQSQRPVGVVAGDPVERQPLRRRDDAARNAHADHEAVSLLKALLGTLATHVAIVLKVGAVKFDELLVVLGDRSG